MVKKKSSSFRSKGGGKAGGKAPPSSSSELPPDERPHPVSPKASSSSSERGSLARRTELSEHVRLDLTRKARGRPDSGASEDVSSERGSLASFQSAQSVGTTEDGSLADDHLSSFRPADDSVLSEVASLLATGSSPEEDHEGQQTALVGAEDGRRTQTPPFESEKFESEKFRETLVGARTDSSGSTAPSNGRLDVGARPTGSTHDESAAHRADESSNASAEGGVLSSVVSGADFGDANSSDSGGARSSASVLVYPGTQQFVGLPAPSAGSKTSASASPVETSNASGSVGGASSGSAGGASSSAGLSPVGVVVSAAAPDYEVFSGSEVLVFSSPVSGSEEPPSSAANQSSKQHTKLSSGSGSSGGFSKDAPPPPIVTDEEDLFRNNLDEAPPLLTLPIPTHTSSDPYLSTTPSGRGKDAARTPDGRSRGRAISHDTRDGGEDLTPLTPLLPGVGPRSLSKELVVKDDDVGSPTNDGRENVTDTKKQVATSLVASVVAEMITMPLDTLKTMQQVHGGTAIEISKQILRNQGVGGFFHGTTTRLVQTVGETFFFRGYDGTAIETVGGTAAGPRWHRDRDLDRRSTAEADP